MALHIFLKCTRYYKRSFGIVGYRIGVNSDAIDKRFVLIENATGFVSATSLYEGAQEKLGIFVAIDYAIFLDRAEAACDEVKHVKKEINLTG